MDYDVLDIEVDGPITDAPAHSHHSWTIKDRYTIQIVFQSDSYGPIRNCVPIGLPPQKLIVGHLELGFLDTYVFSLSFFHFLCTEFISPKYDVRANWLFQWFKNDQEAQCLPWPLHN